MTPIGVPGPSRIQADNSESTPKKNGRVRRALEESNSSTLDSEQAPKRKKLKMAEFQQREHILADDSDDSIGPSVSLRGAKTPNKRPEKENRLSVQNNSVSSSNQRKTVSKYFGNLSRSGRKKKFWTPEETELVRKGFERYGTTCRLIRERFFPVDSPRTIENIRDKIKTMQRRGELPLIS